MEHFQHYDSIKNISIKELLERINSSFKITIRDLKLTDLIYEKQSLCGVYVIYDTENKPAYVGKSGSRTFLERIASHFVLRTDTYMNNFLCALAGKKKSQVNIEELKEAFVKSLKYKIIFISLPDQEKSDKERIGRLESILCRELHSYLNLNRSKNDYRLDTLIKDV